jgi:hypothetical protein
VGKEHGLEVILFLNDIIRACIFIATDATIAIATDAAIAVATDATIGVEGQHSS